jgi:hypothetical protein
MCINLSLRKETERLSVSYVGPPVLPPPPPDTLNRHTSDWRGIISRSSAIVRDQRGAKELSCQERQSFSTTLQCLRSSGCSQQQLCSCPDTAESTDVFLDAQQLGGSHGVGGDECSNPLASWMRISCSLSKRDRRGRCIPIRLRLD